MTETCPMYATLILTMGSKLPPSAQKLLLFSLFLGISMGVLTIIIFYPDLAKLTLSGGAFMVLCVAFWQLAEVTINDQNKLGKGKGVDLSQIRRALEALPDD